jgi:uncharacterized protein (TIGR02099 family)
MQIRAASSLGGGLVRAAAGLARTGTWLARTLEVLAWAAFFAFALALLGLRYWLLPNAERYREDLTAAISRSIGLPVRIGAIETDWLGLRPRLTIADVRVYDRQGREALVLPLVENVLSWRSALMLELRLRTFVIEGPKLTVRRDRDGGIFVAGLRVSGEKGDGGLADWILEQHEVVVRGAEIEWRDELRGAPPLVLSALDFRLRNDGELHQIGFAARPPRHLGPGVELRAELYGRSVTQLAQWNGRVYAQLGYTDLAGWRAWLDYPLDLRSGEGALRVWASLQAGRLKRVTADVALANVAARLDSDLPLLEIASVSGRLQGRAGADGYEFGVRNLALATAHAPPMRSTSFRALWQPGAGARAQRGSVSADLIELAPLARLAEYLPFPADLRKLLADLAPQGNLLDTRFDWSGELQAGASYSARTRFSGLAVNAWGSVPGFAGLSGALEASESKGKVHLAAQDAQLELPRIFPEPRLHFDALNGELAWERRPGGAWAVRLVNVAFANQDLAGTAFGSYLARGEAPGAIDLSAQIARADGARTARYLPLATIVGEETRQWLARSILAGRVVDGRVRLKGELRDFPFVDPGKGLFQVAARFRDGVLDYADGWPRVEAIAGELLFERDRMEIVGRSGAIRGARVANVRASILSLLAHRPRLVIEGQAEGPSAEFLGFIGASPVRRMIDGLTDEVSALGRGRLRLRLELPLGDLAKTRVAGEYQLAANTLAVDPRLPPIVAASGRVSFTESSLTLHDVRGQLFGDAVTLSGGVTPETGIAIAARGRATVEGLRAVFDHPWRSRLSGAANYTVAVTVKDGRTQLRFESPLQGVGSTLPPPLAKIAGDTLPVRVDVFPGEDRQRVSVTLDRLLAAEFLQARQGGVLRLQRAAVALNPAPGEAPGIPERGGFAIRGTTPALDLDRWLPFFAEGGEGGDERVSFDLRVGVLDAIGKRLRDASLVGLAEAGGWSAKMSAQEFAGDLVYRGEGGGRLVARFSRFTLPEDHPGAKAYRSAKQLPAVDLVAERFVHRGRNLGRVEIAARHEGKDWRIDKLAVTSAEAALAGKGLWRTGDDSRTSLAFKLDVNDVGRFLDRFGYPDHVKGANGSLEGKLEWNGDPVLIDYATLSGALQLQAGDGQFLEIEPGIGKLVALMSLQMLPRRIALDFRDVFSKGFKFDRISGSLGVTRGVMQVQDFRMRGPAAEVLMNGQIDLSLETQNLRVKVVPSLGDTASTVAGVIGGPVAGVATMIAQRMLKNPLGQIFSYDYAITGTWGDPKVEKVQTPPPQVPESSLPQGN